MPIVFLDAFWILSRSAIIALRVQWPLFLLLSQSPMYCRCSFGCTPSPFNLEVGFSYPILFVRTTVSVFCTDNYGLFSAIYPAFPSNALYVISSSNHVLCPIAITITLSTKTKIKIRKKILFLDFILPSGIKHWLQQVPPICITFSGVCRIHCF